MNSAPPRAAQLCWPQHINWSLADAVWGREQTSRDLLGDSIRVRAASVGYDARSLRVGVRLSAWLSPEPPAQLQVPAGVSKCVWEE